MTDIMSSTRAHPLLRTLHWLMAFAIIVALACIYSKGLFARGSTPRAMLITVHITAGLSVLLLVLPRLATRLLAPLPPIMPAPVKWQQGLAHLGHVALYLGMLAIPLLGILFVQAAGRPVAYFGVELPLLITPDKALSHGIKGVHETLGLILLWLVVVHAAAALWHHRIVRDNTLRRML